MRRVKCLTMILAIVSMVSVASGQTFWEDFESYNAGPIHGLGGWAGWDNTPGAGAPVSTAQAFSGSKSIEIVPAADLVQEFSIAGGKWVFTARQYIPSGGTGVTYFILMNQYSSGRDWSIQSQYNLATGVITPWSGVTNLAEVIFDKWVELKFVIDLDENTVDEYYDGILIDTRQWDDNTHGTLEAIDLYGNNASSVFYDNIKIQSYLSTLTSAESPTPAPAAVDVPRDSVLTWTPGTFAATHNVTFGTSFEAVENSTTPTASGLTVTSFDPGRLEFGQDYYWRVDEVNAAPDSTVFTGEIWSFTAEPYSVQIPAASIVATASSSANEFSPPEKTIDGSGLTGNVHSINPENMWFSATVDLDPWIQYEFDTIKQLDSMKVWNSNGAAEMALGWGVKDVVIEYSVDGEDWDVLADANQFSRAPGSATYDTYDTIAFGGVPARFVRFDIENNWGGILMSYSLSEIQFMEIPAAARQPVPSDGAGDALPNAIATWRAGREAATHTLYLSTDPNAVADASAPSASSNSDSLDLSPFNLDMEMTYYWRVDEVNEAEATPVWEGPVWSFTTAASLIVDDFESYGNASPNRPFQTWLDGFGYSEDEFFPVGYPGNGTGAGIGHDIWSLSSPHFDGDIMETESTIAGSSQSMPFYYTNSGGVASETQRVFAVPQDWTVGSARTLLIAFRGTVGNTGSLYVKINDTKVAYEGNPISIGRPAWTLWPIDLAATGASLSNVTKLAIGMDGNAASGMLLIDDILLYAKTFESMSSDITTPGDVVQGVPNDDDWPAAESPDLAIDDNTATKYLHRKGGAMATGLQISPMVGATVVTGLTLTTANDTPNRDPIVFELSGSNASLDGPYELIATGDVIDFAGEAEWPRFSQNDTAIEFENTVAYTYYQIVFPALRGANEALMQISEVGLIGTIQ